MIVALMVSERTVKRMAEYIYEYTYGDGFGSAGVKQILVRCKDCKHRPISNGISHPLAPKLDGWSDYACPCLCDDEYYNFMPDDNDYCSRGERKEVEE